MAGEVVPVAVAIIVATASAVKVIMEITIAIMHRITVVGAAPQTLWVEDGGPARLVGVTPINLRIGIVQYAEQVMRVSYGFFILIFRHCHHLSIQNHRYTNDVSVQDMAARPNIVIS